MLDIIEDLDVFYCKQERLAASKQNEFKLDDDRKLLRKQLDDLEGHARQTEANRRALDSDLQRVRGVLGEKEAENHVCYH